jgi:hypothetical protein
MGINVGTVVTFKDELMELGKTITQEEHWIIELVDS